MQRLSSLCGSFAILRVVHGDITTQCHVLIALSHALRISCRSTRKGVAEESVFACGLHPDTDTGMQKGFGRTVGPWIYRESTDRRIQVLEHVV